MNPDRPNRSNNNNPGAPPTNPIQTGALIAVSLIAAVSFAVYESPEVRQFAENLRRQFAAKLRQLGDHVDPAQRMAEDPFSGQPMFNRPEDAEGVRQQNTEDGVEADEESQRRQKEEIEYWNKLAEQQRKAAKAASKGKGDEEAGPSGTRGFDDFLEKDSEGHHVYNTGADVHQTEDLTHRQGRGMDRSNPFSDENGIEFESTASSWAGARKVTVDLANSLISPRKDELISESDGMNSDIYNASDNRMPNFGSHQPTIEQSMEWENAVSEPKVATADPLIDLSEPFNPAERVKKEEDDQGQYTATAHITRPVNDDAFAAIHAWNESASSLLISLDQSNSSGTARNFYSPLPTTPKVTSETSDGDFGSAEEFRAGAGVEVESLEDESEEGVPTPTESMSIIGDHESLGGSEYGRHTPGSWTEVGSSVSGEEIRQRL